MNWRKNKKPIVFAGLLLVFTALAVFSRINAESLGSWFGRASGQAVGNLTGSYRGVTEGIEEGAVAGTQEGLSAKDTTIDVKSGIQEIGKLEVLAAGVRVNVESRLGEAYKSLKIVDGNAVFTIDLQDTEIAMSQSGDEMFVVIPEPTCEVYLDINSTQKLAGIQKFSLSVGAEDGARAYLNTLGQIGSNIDEAIEGYDSIFEEAKNTGREQVKQLAETLCFGKYDINVQYR